MNEKRFKETVMPLHKTLYAVALSILRNESDAQDCLQEAYSKLWESRGRLAEIQNVGAYAMTCVRNTAISMVAKRRDEIMASDPPPDFADSDPAPDRVMESKDSLRNMRLMILDLPENQRKVLTLSSVAGLSNSEIKDVTGLSDDNVRVLLSRARKKLRSLFLNSL